MNDETTLLIKLPKELKTLYQSLCKLNDVTVSSQLRDFMRLQIAQATMPQATARKPKNDVLSPSSDKPVQQPRQSYKNAVQADLVLNDTAASAIKAKAARDKRKQTNKKKKR